MELLQILAPELKRPTLNREVMVLIKDGGEEEGCSMSPETNAKWNELFDTLNELLNEKSKMMK